MICCKHGQLLPDPDNCSKYIHCNEGNPIVRPCPAGLLFNPTLTVCDWPQNVQCGGTTGSGGDSQDIPVSGDEDDNNALIEKPQPETTQSTTTSTTTTSSTTSLVSTSARPQAPMPSSQHITFAPYFDVNKLGPNLHQVYSKSGQKDFTLAFALGSSEGCKPKWGGVSDLNDEKILGPIRQLQALGGHFIVATGGAMGPYFEQLCTTVDDLANAYKTVLDAVRTNHIDVDIESTIDSDRVNKALAKVQQERPNTTVSYTMMVQAEDYGLTPILGVDILRNAKKNGVQVTLVNPMTMEFGGPSPDFGDSVIGAAKAVLQQMKQIWPEKSPAQLNRMLGVTPMIGRNFNGKIFRQDHARKLVNWANQNKIGLLAFWSAGRDNGGCAGGPVSPSCSSISQSEYEFIKIFQEFRG